MKKVIICLLFIFSFVFCEGENKKLEENISELIEELGDSDIITNYQAGRKILKIGEPAIPYLIKSLNHEKGRVRFTSIILLEQLKAKEAIPEFIKIFKDKNRKERERTASALALGRLEAKEASPILIEGLSEESSSIKSACIISVGMLKEEKAVPYLLKYVKDKEKQIGNIALRALKEIGDKGIPEIEKIIENGKFEEKLTAIQVLGEIRSEESINLLKKLLKSENKYLSISSAYVLSTIGKNDGKEIAEKLVKDRDPKIKALAIETLQNIEKIENGGEK